MGTHALHDPRCRVVCWRGKVAEPLVAHIFADITATPLPRRRTVSGISAERETVEALEQRVESLERGGVGMGDER